MESKSISMLRFWAAVAVAGALGTALAMDLPAAADRAFITPAGGGAPRGGFGRRDGGGAERGGQVCVQGVEPDDATGCG